MRIPVKGGKWDKLVDYFIDEKSAARFRAGISIVLFLLSIISTLVLHIAHRIQATTESTSASVIEIKHQLDSSGLAANYRFNYLEKTASDLKAHDEKNTSNISSIMGRLGMGESFNNKGGYFIQSEK